MRLYELDGPSTNNSRYPKEMTVLAGQLKNELEDNEGLEITAQELLDRLQNQFDLVVDIDDLYNAVKDKNHPMSSIIDNIQGDKVVFKGQGAAAKPMDTAIDGERQEKIVSDMAKRTLK